MKKQWVTPELTELNINETAYGIFGWYEDGGTWGDGIISGHHTFCRPNPSPCKPDKPSDNPSDNPTNPTEPFSC